jgi:hypothetical protein
MKTMYSLQKLRSHCITRRYNPEDHTRRSHRCETCKSKERSSLSHRSRYQMTSTSFCARFPSAPCSTSIASGVAYRLGASLDIAAESGVKLSFLFQIKYNLVFFLSSLALLSDRTRALSYSFSDLLLERSDPVTE